MDYTLLGGSGLKISSLCFGLGRFGRGTEFFRVWGSTGVEEGKNLLAFVLTPASMYARSFFSNAALKHLQRLR
jgi:hypothetical protein